MSKKIPWNQVGDLRWMKKVFLTDWGNDTKTIYIQGTFMDFVTFQNPRLFILLKMLTYSFVHDCKKDCSSYLPCPNLVAYPTPAPSGSFDNWSNDELTALNRCNILFVLLHYDLSEKKRRRISFSK